MKNCELKYEIVGLIHNFKQLVDGIEVMHDQFDELKLCMTNLMNW